MNNLEIQKEITAPQEDLGEKQSDRLGFLDDPQFTDIKDPLTKTINDLANEQIITPEEDFWNNIQQVTEKIFSDPLYNFDPEQKTIDAKNISLFRTGFKEISKNNEEKKITEEKKEISEIINNSISEVEESYTNIDKKYKPTDKEIEKFKNEDTKLKTIIENENFKNLSPEKQNLYIKYRYAGEQIAKEALASKDKSITKENYEFIQKFNKLDTNLGLGNPIDLSGLTIIEEIESESEPKDDEEKSERSMKDMVYDEDWWKFCIVRLFYH